jgi:formylmethanofuran dehydrogenase subunit E
VQQIVQKPQRRVENNYFSIKQIKVVVSTNSMKFKKKYAACQLCGSLTGALRRQQYALCGAEPDL